MEIKLRRYSSIYIVDISGEMDMYNAGDVKKVINVMIRKNIQYYIINLEYVGYIDSSGIGALIYIHSQLKKRNMVLRIVNVKGTVKKVIELTKITGYLQIAQSLEDGIAQIKELL
ncbi:MAG: anti-sigma F factor antagonist [Spirochaetes bacterium]|nr:MAG: anti-sigma F factor antagonist [Spirochaetota bacterium]